MKSWEVSQKLESFFTGGSLFISQDGSQGFSLVNGQVCTFSVPGFRVLNKSFDEILEFTLCPDDILLTYGEDDMLVYRAETEVRFKSGSRVVCMQADKRGLLATGNSDNSVKVYQILQGYMTHKLKHKQPVTAVCFCEPEIWLASASLDNTIKIWDLAKYTCLHTVQVKDTIRFLSCDPSTIFSVSSEEIVRITHSTWKQKSLKIKSSAFLNSKMLLLGNEQGELIKVSKKKLLLKKPKKISQLPIKLLAKLTNEFLVGNEESSIYVVNRKLGLVKEFIGHLDEVLDLKVRSSGEIVVCLNSSEAKIMEVSDWSVKSLLGHTDNILCSDVQNEFILTGSKDKLINLYRDCELESTFRGHTEEITSVCFSKSNWFVSSSLDLTLKVWSKTEKDPQASLFTCVAHIKDISSVKVSPDSKLIISASQDKLIKLWSPKLKPKKELAGHKRGVWDINFHPNEKILCSSSGDMTIKLWSLDSFECIRTLEGSQNSILKVSFLHSVLISTSSDGLLKIWDYKTGTCLQTSEAHNGKIWALALLKSENTQFLLTGGTDSCISLWKDVTVEKEEQEIKEKKEVIKLEQDLQLSLRNGQYVQAALLAFRLKRPKSLYAVVNCMNKEEICNFVDGLMETPEGLTALLTHIRDWNCFKKYSGIAQVLLAEVIDRVPADMLVKDREILDAIVLYSRKHFDRADKLFMESFLVEHLMNEIAMMPVKQDLELLPSKKQKVEV